jgi:hypothetical protein
VLEKLGFPTPKTIPPVGLFLTVYSLIKTQIKREREFTFLCILTSCVQPSFHFNV